MQMLHNAGEQSAPDNERLEVLKQIVEISREQSVSLDAAASSLLAQRGVLPPMLSMALTAEYERRYPGQPAPTEEEQVQLLKEMAAESYEPTPRGEPTAALSDSMLSSIISVAHMEYSRYFGHSAASDHEAMLLMQALLDQLSAYEVNSIVPLSVNEECELATGIDGGGGVRIRPPVLAPKIKGPAQLDLGSLPLALLEASACLSATDPFGRSFSSFSILSHCPNPLNRGSF